MVENAVVGARATVGAGSVVVGSVIGDEAELGDGCELRNLAVIGRARRSARPTSSITACASAPTSRFRTRRSASRRRAPSRYSFAPRRVEKPWGWELIWAEADQYVGKLLFIRAGEALSLQYHEMKHEPWLVHEGQARLELGQADDGALEIVEVVPGDALRYPPGTLHRVTALEDTLILEVSTPRTSTTSSASRTATRRHVRSLESLVTPCL